MMIPKIKYYTGFDSIVYSRYSYNILNYGMIVKLNHFRTKTCKQFVKINNQQDSRKYQYGF